MPPREAKGRYLTREYMADADFWRRHDAATRELYLMLAMFADDAGWLEWDPDYLMYTIYRYDNDRDDVWEMGIAGLLASGRLRVLKCGHAEMPKVRNSPRSGGHEERVKDAHLIQCQSKKVNPSRLGTKRQPDPTLPNLTRPDNLLVTSQHRAAAPARGGTAAPLKDLIGELKPGILKDG